MKIQILYPNKTNLNSDFQDLVVEVVEESNDRWYFWHKGVEWYCFKSCGKVIETRRRTHLPAWL